MARKKKEQIELPSRLLMYLYQYKDLTDQKIAEFDQYEREEYDEERQYLIKLGLRDFLKIS